MPTPQRRRNTNALRVYKNNSLKNTAEKILFNLNNEQLHIEEIDAYLQGKLNPEETAAFEQKLKSDSSFAEAFKNQKLLSELIKENARLELKAFLNTHAKTKLISSNNWLQSKIFAIAATAVILIGAFIVFQFYSSPKLEQNIALEETAPITETETQEPVVVSPESDQNKQSESYNDKDLLNEIVPPTIEEQKAVDMELADEPPPVMEGNVENMRDDADIDFKVASEIKNKDTILYAIALTMLDADGSSSSYGFNKTAKAKSAQLPAAASNSNQAKALEDTKKSENTEKKAKLSKPASSNAKYSVEYWTSPVNFKGYRLSNTTLQLFGLNAYTCQLFTVNGNLYLRNQGKVYVLSPCIDACPYKLEVDPDIVQFILNQN